MQLGKFVVLLREKAKYTHFLRFGQLRLASGKAQLELNKCNLKQLFSAERKTFSHKQNRTSGKMSGFQCERAY